jgi:putative lipoic acid-binding regulatory protein
MNSKQYNELKQQNKEFKAKVDYINSLQKQDYKDLKELMYKFCSFANIQTISEPCYINLWVINAFIEDFEAKVIQSIGERKTSAEKHLKTLYDIQSQYGKYYFESIIYRAKVQELQSDVIKMSKKIDELQSENIKLKKLNEF